jgi:Ca2+/H+ antiporter
MIAVAVIATGLATLFLTYQLGRYAEMFRWQAQRDAAFGVIADAQRKIEELRTTERHSLQILAEQRDLLDTFASATETLYDHHDDTAWRQLWWASHRARTELL